jgi:ActR/RegA family two-component response regulator
MARPPRWSARAAAVVDLTMPEPGGVRALAAIRRTEQATRVVAICGIGRRFRLVTTAVHAFQVLLNDESLRVALINFVTLQLASRQQPLSSALRSASSRSSPRLTFNALVSRAAAATVMPRLPCSIK